MSDTTRIETRPSGRHPVNIGHLVMGLALLGLVGMWALIEGDLVTGDDIRWLLPVPWVLAGVAGLTASAVTGARRHSVRRTGWVGTTPDATAPASAQTTAPATAPTTETTPVEDPEENR